MPTSIFREEVQSLIQDEAAQLVEVLPPAEYEEQHIQGALSIPLKDLEKKAAELLAKDRPVVVY